MEARRYLELKIAEEFTRVDGTTQLYVAQESVFPGLSAWPVPHDAPYKHRLDRCIMFIKEGGLYEKWSNDLLNEIRRESRMRQREQELEQHESEAANSNSENTIRALTVIHMQGPLLLLLLGLSLAAFTFLCEFITDLNLQSK
ncbi:uncharacterized protein LOC121868962 [Homarus americanus]|uniref:uncharacterized protein LOC121868962 n=1 Tax=Homarus americanus TaxID=6706 RepID=UPI001C44F8D4|nr:uncharacterized protein LOC121868962 [Homarus americanus]